jgi:hypothetical protein
VDRRGRKARYPSGVVAGQCDPRLLRRRPLPNAVDQLLQDGTPRAGLSLQGLNSPYLAFGIGDARLELGHATSVVRSDVRVAPVGLPRRAARLELFQVAARPPPPCLRILEQDEGRRRVDGIAIGGKQALPSIRIDIHRSPQAL